MFVTRFLSIAVAALASVSFVGAAPTPEKDVQVKRYAADSAYAILDNLSVRITAQVGLLDAYVGTVDVPYATIAAPVIEIIALVGEANVQATVLLPILYGDPEYNDCANLLEVIVAAVVSLVAKLALYVEVFPGLIELFFQLDASLYALLVTINIAVPNIIAVVASLLVSLQVIVSPLYLVVSLGYIGY